MKMLSRFPVCVFLLGSVVGNAACSGEAGAPVPPPKPAEPAVVATASPSPAPSAVSAEAQSATAAAVPQGIWGGSDMELTVSPEENGGNVIQFRCAYARIEGTLAVGIDHRFAAQGVYHKASGPLIAGDPQQYPARFDGEVQGDVMQLHLEYQDYYGQTVQRDETLHHGVATRLSGPCPR